MKKVLIAAILMMMAISGITSAATIRLDINNDPAGSVNLQTNQWYGDYGSTEMTLTQYSDYDKITTGFKVVDPQSKSNNYFKFWYNDGGYTSGGKYYGNGEWGQLNFQSTGGAKSIDVFARADRSLFGTYNQVAYNIKESTPGANNAQVMNLGVLVGSHSYKTPTGGATGWWTTQWNTAAYAPTGKLTKVVSNSVPDAIQDIEWISLNGVPIDYPVFLTVDLNDPLMPDCWDPTRINPSYGYQGSHMWAPYTLSDAVAGNTKQVYWRTLTEMDVLSRLKTTDPETVEKIQNAGDFYGVINPTGQTESIVGWAKDSGYFAAWAKPYSEDPLAGTYTQVKDGHLVGEDYYNDIFLASNSGTIGIPALG
jgi:hypothetical protein